MAQEQKPANPAEESAAEPNDNANGVPQGEGSGEDFAGYKSLADMRAAIYESRKEGKRLADQNAQLAGYVTRLMKAEKPEPEAADELGELGIPVEALRRTVREVVQAELAPMGRTQEAISSVRSTHPGFAKSEADFNRWLNANPDVVSSFNQSVAESPRSAEMLLKGVFAEYESTRRPESEPDDPKRKVSSDARIPNSRGSGGSVRREAADKPNREEMQELVKDARRRGGNPVEIMRALLGDKPIHRDLRPAPKG